MHPNLVNYAISYAKKGFSVIPIGLSKKPLIKFADQQPLKISEIEKVWNKYPYANIALKTDKFFVIDVDRHGETDGLESIKDLNHDEWFKNTLIEKTAHNGYHFFFQKPVNEEIQQNIGFLPGVDLKAHKNNYVVVAPSQIGDKKYQWLNHEIIRPAPVGLLELIREKQKKVPDTLAAKIMLDMRRRTKTTTLFETIVNGFGDEGGRNDNLSSFMGGLLFRNVNPYIAAKLAVIANEHTKDPLPLKEVERTINSMIEKENRKRERMNYE